MFASLSKFFAADSLNRIGKRHGTDKYRHGYLPFYERHLGSLRASKVVLLEIGILGGHSLRMWAEYFVNGQIIGADIVRERFIQGERIACHYLDQSSRDSLIQLKALFPDGFDIIVDDGSHVMAHQQTTLAVLFPALKPGGLYVIEDLHTSLGTSEKCFESFGLERDMSNSTARLLESLHSTDSPPNRYMNEGEIEYLKRNVASCELFRAKGWSMTSMLRKRG